MRVAYLNGEKVYVVGDDDEGIIIDEIRDGFLDKNKIQFCRHRDLVSNLNEIFKCSDPAVCAALYLTIVMAKRGSKPLWSEARKGSIIFDDPQKVKKARIPQLRTKTYNQHAMCKFIVHKGGLYEPPVRKDMDEPLSAEFGGFLEKERSPEVTE